MKRFGIFLLALVLITAMVLPCFGGTLSGDPVLAISAQADEYYEDYEEEEGSTFLGVVICFVIALVIAFIVIFILKAQLKSVAAETRADRYSGPDALVLTYQDDTYTHTTVDRRYDPEDKSDDSDYDDDNDD